MPELNPWLTISWLFQMRYTPMSTYNMCINGQSVFVADTFWLYEFSPLTLTIFLTIYIICTENPQGQIYTILCEFAVAGLLAEKSAVFPM